MQNESINLNTAKSILPTSAVHGTRCDIARGGTLGALISGFAPPLLNAC